MGAELGDARRFSPASRSISTWRTSSSSMAGPSSGLARSRVLALQTCVNWNVVSRDRQFTTHDPAVMARKRDVVARTLPIVVALAFALATLNTSNQLSALREEHGKLTQLHRIASNDLSKMMTNRGDCKQKLDELEVTHAEDLATHVSETQMKIEEYEGANKDLRDELKACKLAKDEAQADAGEALGKLESSRNEAKQLEQEVSQMRAQGCREDPPAPDAPSS